MCKIEKDSGLEEYEFSSWDKKFIDLSKFTAGWSKDKSTKVGAITVNENNSVLTVGYNGFPRGVDDSVESRFERPDKYFYTEHAERNCIYNAAYEGIALKDSTIYVTLFPCDACARGIIQCGIKKVFAPKPDFDHHKYGESFVKSLEMLTEANVQIIYCN